MDRQRHVRLAHSEIARDEHRVLAGAEGPRNAACFLIIDAAFLGKLVHDRSYLEIRDIYSIILLTAFRLDPVQIIGFAPLRQALPGDTQRPPLPKQDDLPVQTVLCVLKQALQISGRKRKSHKISGMKQDVSDRIHHDYMFISLRKRLLQQIQLFQFTAVRPDQLDGIFQSASDAFLAGLQQQARNSQFLRGSAGRHIADDQFAPLCSQPCQHGTDFFQTANRVDLHIRLQERIDAAGVFRNIRESDQRLRPGDIAGQPNGAHIVVAGDPNINYRERDILTDQFRSSSSGNDDVKSLFLSLPRLHNTASQITQYHGDIQLAPVKTGNRVDCFAKARIRRNYQCPYFFHSFSPPSFFRTVPL